MKKYILSISSIIIIGVVFSCTPPKQGGSSVRTGGFFSKPVSKGKLVRVLLKKTKGSQVVSSKHGLILSNADSGEVIYRGKDAEFNMGNVIGVMKVDAEKEGVEINGSIYRGYVIVRKKNNYIYFINVLTMEEYLCGVVPVEMSPSWPIEALKAQAVAARSYAVNHISIKKSELYDVDSTTNFQVYRGMSCESKISNNAVFSTAGEVLLYDSKPIMAFFHSTCGGHTSDNSYVWKGKDLPYLEPVKCDYCKDSPHYTWHDHMDINSLAGSIRKKYSEVSRVQGIRFKKHKGRVYEADIKYPGGKVILSGNELRMLIGAKKIKSLYFKARKEKNGISVDGHGFGHGVGMCQYGAKGMAVEGYNYKQILQKYYRGAVLKK